MTVAEWKALSLGPVAGKRDRKDVQNLLSTWNTSVLFTLTLNLRTTDQTHVDQHQRLKRARQRSALGTWQSWACGLRRPAGFWRGCGTPWSVRPSPGAFPRWGKRSPSARRRAGRSDGERRRTCPPRCGLRHQQRRYYPQPPRYSCVT